MQWFLKKAKNCITAMLINPTSGYIIRDIKNGV